MRICFFGESYVNGIGDPTYQGWVGRLCEIARKDGHDITGHNCGIRGATSDLVLRTWRGEADARLKDIDKAAVVFSYGTNDCWRENDAPRVSFERQLENTRTILREAAAHWSVVMIGPPGLTIYADNTIREPDHRARCVAMEKICAELNVPYFDTLGIFSSFKHWPTEARNYDGAHPGAGGYAEMAEAIATWPSWRALLKRLKT
jgi:acyl-CoA thioesterase I